MQYAEIVPNTKTDLLTQTFTYKIPPEFLPNLKIGSLVVVPFGKRKIEGIVIKIKKLKGKVQKEKLKSILTLLESEPILDEIHLKLAEWMAEYYLAPLSLCLFEMIPLPPKKKDKEERIKEIDSNLPTEALAKVGYLSPILRLCQRALAKNKQILILFPDVNLAKDFLPYFQKKFSAYAKGYGGPADLSAEAKAEVETSSEGGNNVVLYHGELSKNERWKVFTKIKKGRADVVVGSHLAIFAPLSRLGLIIIIDEETETYKNERSPRYHPKTVAEKLTQLQGAKLVLLSPTPSVESYYNYSKKRVKKRENSRVYLIRHALTPPLPHSLILIDMKKEIQKGNYSPLSETLQNILKITLKRGGRSILFVPRKGAASYIFCRDCGYVFLCPNCQLPLTYHFITSPRPPAHQLICHHCSFKTQPPSLCPNCHGLNLKFAGLGTQKIEAEVKKMFIKPEILRLDQDLSPLSYLLYPDIIIGTQKILSNWSQPVDLVALVSIDSLLNLPDFRQGEKVFSIIFRLKSLASKLFLVQTYHPENFLIHSALKGDYLGFYQKELQNRKKLNFPPFSKLIRIIYQHKNEQKCQKEIKMFAEKLKSLITPSLHHSITLLGPSSCFYSKIRGKFRWQIVIKIPTSHFITSSLHHLLKTLPSDWIIDVDPVTLL